MTDIAGLNVDAPTFPVAVAAAGALATAVSPTAAIAVPPKAAAALAAFSSSVMRVSSAVTRVEYSDFSASSSDRSAVKSSAADAATGGNMHDSMQSAAKGLILIMECLLVSQCAPPAVKRGGEVIKSN